MTGTEWSKYTNALINDMEAEYMKRIAVIGCGLRADCYLTCMSENATGQWTLAAVADPRENARDLYIRQFGSEKTRSFAEGPELLDAMRGELDGVMICSPNTLHIDSLVPAVEQELTILLEKPVVTRLEDGTAAWTTHQKHPRAKIVVGFVLRYAPYFRAIRATIARGEIGRVLAITATEQLSPSLSANYLRGWRSDNNLTGFFLLEKCSHDLDLLQWFAVAMDQPQSRRNILIMGTEGQIERDPKTGGLLLRRHPSGTQDVKSRVEELTFPEATSGHGGGDEILSEQFMDMLEGRDVKPDAGLQEGIDAVLACLAAEQAQRERTAVDCDSFFASVYGNSAFTQNAKEQ